MKNEKDLCRIFITNEDRVRLEIPELTPGELLELNFHMDLGKHAVMNRLNKYRDFIYEGDKK